MLGYPKAKIGSLLLGGDYLHFLPGAEYRKGRATVIGAGMDLMRELRAELKAPPPVLVEMTVRFSMQGWKEEALSKEQALLGVIKDFRDPNRIWREQQRLRLEGSSALLARKEIPEKLSRMESDFVALVEQEYRRIPAEKGEIEDIVARAGLPRYAEARLKLLILR